MHLDDLVEKIINSSEELLASLRSGDNLTALGLRRSARLPVVAALHRALNRPILLITDRIDNALTLSDELALWAGDIPRIFIPEPTPLYYEEAAWGENTRRDRLKAITMLASYHIPGGVVPEHPPILIAPARAVMTRTLPRRDFLKVTRTLKPEQILSPEELARSWVRLGYEPVNTVISSGQFARRGGILDVWPPAEPRPVRIEFFGDEVDTLRRFDPSTQRTLETIDRLLFTPAKEFLLPRDDDSKDERLEYYTRQEGLSFTEFHLPLLHKIHASLLDYLPNDSLVLIEDLQVLQDTINDVEEQAVNMRRDFIEEGTLPADFPVPYLSWTEIEDSMTGKQVVELGSSPGAEESTFATRFRPEPRFGGRLKTLQDYLVEVYLREEPLLVVSRQASRLEELWNDQSPSQEPEGAYPPLFIPSSLSEGWSFTPSVGPRLHLLTDGEIFGWRRPEPRRRHRPAAEAP
jgi:transcription-repair coupling factor (superfamily II helicase)